MQPPHLLQNNDMASAVVDSFVVEDLLDFPNDDEPLLLDDASLHSFPGYSTNSSSLTAAATSPGSHSNNAFADNIGCRSFQDPHFSGDLCVPMPYDDDMADLEWLSNVVEESFSSEDLQKLQLISGMKARNGVVEASDTHESQAETNRSVNNNYPIFNSNVSVPAKARSKRLRGSPRKWTSRRLLLSPYQSPTPSLSSVSSSSSDPVHSTGKKPGKAASRRKDSSEGRQCLHCATDKTPQWRTGPMGPKTLCNACGVRYKSGRLVPEYRPAASPTFVLTKHSNSHRKVMELRRQKEVQQLQQHHQFLQHPNRMFEFHVSNGDDYLIHQHLGPDFRQLI